MGKKLYKVTLCSLVFAAIIVPITAFDGPQTVKPVEDAKCLSCHQEQKSYLSTAHHFTSRPATKDSIAGKFEEGKNILKTSEPEVYYRMEARNDGFFQTALFGNALTISRQFDLVIGSGRKGQTYLYWDWTVPLDKTNRLNQLPVSFWTELDAWVHSPGYNDKVVNFSRPVFPRCLECHTSVFEAVRDPTLGNLGTVSNSYNKSNYVLGISCEKCHGPGQQHIDLQNDKTKKPADQLIVNTAKLSRERQIGLCALCHGGLGDARAPAFSYTAGDDLEKYVHLTKPGPNEPVDVHGNQVALMEKSRCYQASSMTCSTCHDVHLPQRDPAAFVGRCLTCHKVQSCGLFRKSGDRIAGKCVDCHMPLQNSNLIVSSHEGKKLREQVRTHWIKVYPEIKIP